MTVTSSEALRRWAWVAVVTVCGALLIVAASFGGWQIPAYLLVVVSVVCAGLREPTSRVAIVWVIALAEASVAIWIDESANGGEAWQSIALIAVAPWLAHALARSAARRVEVERLSAAMTLATSQAETARDVHDITSHALMAVITQLRVATRGLDTGDLDRTRRALDAASRASSEAMHELRTLTTWIAERHDPELRCDSSKALRAMLEDVCDGFPAVELEVQDDRAPDDRRLDPAVGAAAVRIVQQCLANGAAHAPGEPMRISARAGSGRLVLRAVNALPLDPPAAGGLGMGLTIMSRRSFELGGTFATTTTDGLFTVTCDLPLVR